MLPEPLVLHELVRICLSGGSAAQWEDLLGRVQPVIARTAWRAAAASGPVRAQDVDDIIQETCLKLGASRVDSIARAALASEGAAFAYIRTMALNAARDHFAWRRRRPVSEEAELAAPLDQLTVTGAPGVDRAVLLAQIDSALDADSRGRSVFWLYYRHGYTAKEISQIPEVGLSIKGVESLLNRLTDSVRRRIDGEKFKGKTAAEAS